MRILCLGNNTEDTDLKTRQLADKAQLPCHGLLSELDQSFDTLNYDLPGYYHTSVVDISVGNLKELMNKFDKVVMLDQPIDQWNHTNEFYNTIALMQSTGTTVEFLNRDQIAAAELFANLLKKNKSFCIFPFIELHTAYDHTRVCCRSNKPVTKIQDLQDFNTDPNYQTIRKSMLDGEMLPDHCGICYERERKGIVSARLSETTEWVYRLGLKTLDDLKTIKKPALYDLRPSDKCNLRCRMCFPEDSHLIAKEYKKLKISVGNTENIKHQQDGFDLVEFDNIKKILVAGGEPAIMPEFFKFLEKCIAAGRTDFEVNVNTNGTNLSNRLKDLVKQFKNFSWVFSIDGYKELNYYIRYPSNWEDIVAHWAYLRDQKNPVTVNTTVSIYNIDSLDQLFHWIDDKFPNSIISCFLLQGPNFLDPLLFPDRDAVLRSLERVTQTNCYKNNEILATTIDSLCHEFQTQQPINEPLLKEFFKFNNLLDQNRNIHLGDYVPNLEKYRNKYDV